MTENLKTRHLLQKERRAWQKVGRSGLRPITITLTVGELHALLTRAQSSLVALRKEMQAETPQPSGGIIAINIAEMGGTAYHKCVDQMHSKQQGKNYYNARHDADTFTQRREDDQAGSSPVE